VTISAHPPSIRPWGRTAPKVSLTGALFLVIALTILCIAGCSREVTREQVPPTASEVWLESGEAVGQTFVAHHEGLEAFEVYVTPEGVGGAIALRLAESSDATEAVAEARAGVPEAGGWVRLGFAPRRDSRQRYYDAELTYAGPGGVRLATAPGDAYLHGALSIDGAPQDAQLAFRLAFDRRMMLLGLAAQVLMTWLPISLAGAFLLLVPGLAILALFRLPNGRDGWPAHLGLAVGLGAALHPVFFLLADLIGLRLGPAYPWAIGMASLGVLAAQRWRSARPLTTPRIAGIWRREAFWPDVALIGVLGLVVVTRLLPIGSLEAPMWGDSFQHTMITRLLVDRGGLFQDWRPYAELRSFSYHYGFHALAAALHWLAGLGAAGATLWMGQMLSILAALALYPLAARVGDSRWAGVGAVLVAGLLSPMPMTYLNWGRYTQLAGQVILPAMACLSLEALETPRGGWRVGVKAVVALAGLSLTHYRVLLLGAPLFAMVLALPGGVPRGRVLGRAFGLAGAALLLALPWYLNVLTGATWRLIWGQVVASAGPNVATGDLGAIADNLSTYLPVWMWLALPLAIGWSLWRRERMAALVALWWLGAFLLVNPQLLGLPGAGTITNFALFIALYIPAAIFLGAALGWLAAAWGAKVTPILATVVVLLVGVLGATQRLAEPNPAVHALVTRPDVRAAQWIAANTPAEARFLVNAFFAYEGSAVVGSDAGWWLPLLAERATTLPPLNYVSEEGRRPEYRLWVNGLTAALKGSRLDEGAIAALREHGVTHVYIGQRRGRVNYAGPDVLDPALFAQSPLFRAIYHQDRVWVFEFLGR
jgi:hypothetical protein